MFDLPISSVFLKGLLGAPGKERAKFIDTRKKRHAIQSSKNTLLEKAVI
jgi:hypothetical protein